MANASSSSKPTENILIEEREEVMVTEKGCCLRKTHFLKPYFTSVDDGFVAELPRQRRLSVSSWELNRLSSRGSFSGFWFAERHFVSWLVKMEALHKSTWRKAGIFEAIKASTYNITKNPSLILSVAEKWCPETKSFVFSWGEATITLEDVMVLLGFSVLGSPVFAPIESSEMRDSVEKLHKVRLENHRANHGSVSQNQWISSFLGRDDQMEHEAFLVLWLSFYVFPCTSRRSISRHVIPIAVRLARGERIALAPTVLASVYRDLSQIHGLARGKCDENVNLKSLFKLVQVWTWERFKNIRPKAREIPKGEPRLAQWNCPRQRYENVRLCFDDFDWRPYTKPLKNWNPLRFYLEEAMWVNVDDSLDDEFASFARCVKVSQLAGDGFVENYYPNRVAMQFGLAQDLPGLVTRHRNFTEQEAWDDYNKSLEGIKLYMPSRLARGSVTARYRDWWLKSVSDFLSSEEVKKESNETFKARNTFDDYDYDDDDYLDVSPKVLPLSQVLQKLEEGFPAKCRRSRTRRLVKKYKTGELVNCLVSSRWKMNKTCENLTNKRRTHKPVQMQRAHEDDDDDDDDDDERSLDKEDDIMTIAQRTRSRKKYSDAEKTGEDDTFEPLVKRSRRFQVVDSDDSGPCQKLASRKTEQMSEEDDDETAEKPEKTRQKCDDGEKKTIVNDESREAECMIHEDGEKQIRYSEKLYSKETDERLRQRKLAIKEIELKLETRIMNMEKSLAMIRKWKKKK